jgi:hypothetical protein
MEIGQIRGSVCNLRQLFGKQNEYVEQLHLQLTSVVIHSLILKF